MANPFERIVRSPLEYSFDSTPEGGFAQQIVKELEGKSNILMDATYMPSSEESRHKGRRNIEPMKNTAVTLASDEGDAFSANGHDVEYSVELGAVGDGCKYNSIQQRNAKNADVIAKERQDIDDTIDSINRKDAFLTVYGNSEAVTGASVDPKGWSGFAYYTRKVTDYDTFQSNYYAGKNPFEGVDMCLTLDNQRGAKKALTATELAEAKFSSIYAVVWGANNVAKLYPKNSMNMGIETEIYEPQTVVYAPRDNTSASRLYKEGYIAFRKVSGVNVHDRFSLIRLANIRFTDSQAQREEEIKRIIENMAFVEEILLKKGFAGGVKFYAPIPLIRQMRVTRYNDAQQGVIYSGANLNQIGTRSGLVGTEFYLNDNYLITPEFQMLNTENFVS